MFWEQVAVFWWQAQLQDMVPSSKLLDLALGALILRLCLYGILPQLHVKWLLLPVALLNVSYYECGKEPSSIKFIKLIKMHHIPVQLPSLGCCLWCSL